jgi:TPR repeat protein
MTLDPRRVAEVWAPGGKTSFGSGYLLTGDLVLTAGHVVDGMTGICEVRPLGVDNWCRADVTRLRECDAALLRIKGARGRFEEPVRLGRVATEERARCQAVGFPLAQAKVLERRDVRDTEEMKGEIAPLSGLKKGLLTIHIHDTVPVRDASGRSPWEGMSGAAVFSGGLLIGIVSVAPKHFGTDRLEAVPVEAVAAEAEFRAAVTGDAARPPALSAVEDEPARALLRRHYLPSTHVPSALRRPTPLLLRPELGIVPFRGREPERDELLAWCADAAPISLALLTGIGGTGKTRLAAELCRACADEGWLVGFLMPEVTADGVRPLADAASSLLLVIDDAHSRSGVIGDLLQTLVRRRSAATRILLLARERGTWWEKTLPQLVQEELDAALALEAATVKKLSAVEPSVAGREAAFDEAAHAFAERTGCPISGSPPDLSDGLFERILFIHLAALTNVGREGDEPEPKMIRDDLVKAALGREERYWTDTAGEVGITVDATVLKRAVVAATLATAAGEAEAATALAAVPDLAGDGLEAVRRQIARWLRDLYPGEGWFRPLEPDVLGEALVADVLEEVPELARTLIDSATPAQLDRTITILNAAAREHPVRDFLQRDADPDFLFRLGLLSYERDMDLDAIWWYQRAAAIGHAAAAFNIGVFFESGGMDAKAEPWYRQAAEAGMERGAFNLALLLANRGQQNEAADWYARAADAGYAPAAYNLAVLLADWGDTDEAARRYTQAAEAGDRRAAFDLAMHLVERGERERSKRWFKAAAEAGDTTAAYNLALLLSEGGENRQAEDWYRQAAEDGAPEAATNLGVLLEERGETDGAERWYRNAAEAGYGPAAYNLALLLVRRGERDEAAHWYNKALEAGVSPQG